MNDIDTNATVDGGDTAGEPQTWLSSVPENLRTNDAFKGIEKSSDAWQQFVDMKVKSENSIQIPGEDASDEDRSAFYGKLGRPETAEEYTIAKPENFPDGVEYDENTENVFRGVFHEMGLSDQNANALWNKYHEMVIQGNEMQQQADKDTFDTAINSLKDKWTGDKFKVNTEIAHRAFSGVFEDVEKQEAAKTFIQEAKIDGLAVGDHPMFLEVFHQIGSIIGDDRINMGRGDGIDNRGSDEAEAQKRFPNIDFKKP